MVKLMKLEMKKFRWGRTIRSAIIANLCIIGFLLFMYFVSKNDKDPAFSSFDDTVFICGTFAKLTFTIFAGVLISKIIVGEYTSKTINLMFMYPISREKILVSKLCLISIFTFCSLIISTITSSAAVYIVSIFDNNSIGNISSEILLKNLGMCLTSSIAFTGTSLIPLFVGMHRKSVQSTIVTSIIIASVLSSNNGGFSLGSILAIPLSLAVLGIFIAYMAIKDIEHKDIPN